MQNISFIDKAADPKVKVAQKKGIQLFWKKPF